MAKRRLDTLLVDRGLAENQNKARALLLSGAVSLGDRPAPKAGILVDEDAPLKVAEPNRYVGRGGEKVEHALDVFGLDVSGLVVADIGASTGGFTDCLLQRGASRVYAIDAGKGQLDYRLRYDGRVVVMEGVNARKLKTLPEPIDFVAVDVSFISLRLVLPAGRTLLEDQRQETGATSASASGSIVALFKPQFEARKDEVPRGGVVRDPQLHATLIGRFSTWCIANGFRILNLTSSPILGADGNREFLFWLRPEQVPARRDRVLARTRAAPSHHGLHPIPSAARKRRSRA
jgi:23S rRNA (cytidine1920-2'-O)/16S rRNA (cytidine1409-2'-O)-methyltransferase